MKTAGQKEIQKFIKSKKIKSQVQNNLKLKKQNLVHLWLQPTTWFLRSKKTYKFEMSILSEFEHDSIKK